MQKKHSHVITNFFILFKSPKFLNVFNIFQDLDKTALLKQP